MSTLRKLLAIGLLVCAYLPASAQPFPSKTVRLVVAYAPGGTGDVVARVIADKLGAALGQSVIVENRAGASGAIGTQSVVGAAPDGHTLLVGQTAEIVVNQYWIKGLGYDPKDLSPVALATIVPLALTVPGKAPYATHGRDVQGDHERRASRSRSPSAGTGTPGHFAGEYLSAKLPGKLVHVPYKGAGPALNDIVGGHVDMYFSGFPAVMPLMKAGSVKMLAVSSAARAQAAPEIPTVAEATGFPDFDSHAVAGLLRAEGHARRGDRPAQPRDQPDPRRSADAAEAARCRRQCDAAVDRANSPPS